MIWIVRNHWWTGLAAGVFLLSFGLYCFVRPDLAVYTLARVFGLFLLLFAAGSGYTAVRMRGADPRWFLAVVQGVLFGLLALFLLATPDSILVLTRVAGIWAVSVGLFRFFLGSAAGGSPPGCSVAGYGLAVLFGMVLFFYPMAFAGFLSVFLGILLMITGAVLLAGSLSARRGTGPFY